MVSSITKNKLAFGQTRFATAADLIEHISEEKCTTGYGVCILSWTLPLEKQG